MNMQEHLIYITELTIKDLKSPKIRGVSAVWNKLENTAYMTFYFDGETTEEELEDAEVACAEIIAHCSNGLLNERFIRLDFPEPLPESSFWAYKRDASPSKGEIT